VLRIWITGKQDTMPYVTDSCLQEGKLMAYATTGKIKEDDAAVYQWI
jgi:hypothetical protein